MKIESENPRRLIIIFILAFALIFEAPLLRPSAYALSTKEERELGQKFMLQVQRSFEFVDDDFAHDYLNDLGQYLVKSLETRPFPFRFHIIKDGNLNAFAGPGGQIFMFSGLIVAMDRVDELASVVCHEIGHVSARHLARRMEQSKKIGIATLAGMLAAVLIGGKAAGAIATGSLAAGAQVQLHYSRNDERQADHLGFQYMDEAGFDPSGLISALKTIQENQWIGTDKIPSYLLTHPTGTERMSNLDVMLSGYAVKAASREVGKYRSRFPFFKTILRAKSFEPREAERFFNEELEKDPDSPLAHFGLGMVFKEISEYDLAIEHLQKALKGQSEPVPILRTLGETYQLKGQDTRAIAILEKSLAIDDKDRSTLFLLAFSYQSLEKYGKAIRLYEKLTLMKPVRNEVYYNLGVSYGRENRLALAHYNFGRYFKRLGRIQKAKFHFEKASALSKNDPALQSRIRKETKQTH